MTVLKLRSNPKLRLHSSFKEAPKQITRISSLPVKLFEEKKYVIGDPKYAFSEGNLFISSATLKKINNSRTSKRNSLLRKMFGKENGTVRNGNYKIYTKKFDRNVSLGHSAPPSHYVEELKSLLKSQNIDQLIKNRKDLNDNLSKAKNEIAVTILIDCSGSMKDDNRKESVAVLTHSLVSFFENVGINSEILGFTVCNDKAEKLYQRRNPNLKTGRVGDLRHIIFKPFSEKINQSFHLANILKEIDEGHGNIDGEAVHWAYNRLKQRNENVRLLLHLTDGNPAGENFSTSANSSFWARLNQRDYFSTHLTNIRKQIQAKSTICPFGVGIGSSVFVDRFYTDYTSVMDANDLGPEIINLLEVISAYLPKK